MLRPAFLVLVLATTLAACGGRSAGGPQSTVTPQPSATADKRIVDAAINDGIDSARILNHLHGNGWTQLVELDHAEAELGSAAALLPQSGLPGRVSAQAADDFQARSSDIAAFTYCVRHVATLRAARACLDTLRAATAKNGQRAYNAVVLLAPYGSESLDQLVRRLSRVTGTAIPPG